MEEGKRRQEKDLQLQKGMANGLFLSPLPRRTDPKKLGQGTEQAHLCPGTGFLELSLGKADDRKRAQVGIGSPGSCPEKRAKTRD